MYDPALGRWNRLDPMGEIYYSSSPYEYTLSNPIRFFDPNGMFSMTINGTEVEKENQNWFLEQMGVELGSSEEKEESKENSLVTFNEPRKPKGPYIKGSLTVKAGPHFNVGSQLFGVGSGIDMGASIQVLNAEELISKSEMYINFEVFNSSDVDIEVGGYIVKARGSIKISKSITTGQITNSEGKLTVYGMSGTASNKGGNFSYTFASVSNTIPSAVPFSFTASVSLENVTFNGNQTGIEGLHTNRNHIDAYMKMR